MRKLLLCAFEPFGGLETNASLETLKRIDNNSCEYEIDKRVLPVVFNKCFEVIKEDLLKYDVIIMLGEAGNREYVSFEYLSKNIMNARIKDNENNQPLNQKIKDGDDLLYTNIDIERIKDSLIKEGFNVYISNDAGEYVCNNLFYLVADYLKNTNIKYDFIHVPYIKDDTNISKTSLDMMVETINKFIERI